MKCCPRTFYLYARPFVHCLYFIYARKFNPRTYVKITRQWKSTIRQGFCIFLVPVRVTSHTTKQYRLGSVKAYKKEKKH